MSLSFIFISTMTMVFLVSSLLLLVFPRKINRIISSRTVIDGSKYLWRYRVGGLIGIGLCILITGLYLLPHAETKNVIGRYYFSKYLENRPSRKAYIYATQAFGAWSFSGNVKSLVNASEKLPMDSPVWKSYLWLAGKGYKRRGRYEQFGPFLHGLEGKIIHPVGKMSLFFELGKFYRSQDKDKAREYFNKVIEINADPFFMDQAEGNLHEMDLLNRGQDAPDFSLKDIHGKQHSLGSLRGRIVILQFWNVNCPSCRKEMPVYKKIYSENQSDKLVMLGVSMKIGEKTSKYIEQEKLEWPQVVLDKRGYHEIGKSYNIQYVPDNYVIGPDGKIAAKHLNAHELKTTIKELLQSF